MGPYGPDEPEEHEVHDHARRPVAHKRQGYACDRHEPERHADVFKNLEQPHADGIQFLILNAKAT